MKAPTEAAAAAPLRNDPTTQGHEQACSGMYAGSMWLVLIDARRSWPR